MTWRHAFVSSQHEAYDILEAAAEENLTGPKYMWLLTSSSVGSVSTFSHKSIPVGTLGMLLTFLLTLNKLSDQFNGYALFMAK